MRSSADCATPGACARRSLRCDLTESSPLQAIRALALDGRFDPAGNCDGRCNGGRIDQRPTRLGENPALWITATGRRDHRCPVRKDRRIAQGVAPSSASASEPNTGLCSRAQSKRVGPSRRSGTGPRRPPAPTPEGRWRAATAADLRRAEHGRHVASSPQIPPSGDVPQPHARGHRGNDARQPCRASRHAMSVPQSFSDQLSATLALQ